MGNQFTEVTRQSWGGRIGNSIGGIFFGFILVVGAFALLFWNEGRSVKTAKSLAEGAKAVVSIASSSIDPTNEGKLVHLSGVVATDEKLSDPAFGVNINAIKLARSVEMYQWDESSSSETDKKLGGGTETATTYTYEKRWSGSLIRSSDFKKPEGHANPIAKPFEDRDFVAKNVKIDDTFTLSNGLINRINDFESLSVDAGRLPPAIAAEYKIHDGGLYKGAAPGTPEVGDVRITFQVIKPGGMVSLISKQRGESFAPFRTKVGKDIEMLRSGQLTAEEMFEAAQSENKVLTWILRVVGYVMMLFGLGMMMAPISVLADVIPFLGNLAGMGTGLIAFVLGTFLSLVTIAIAWITYRPLLGIALIVIGVAPFVLIPMLKKPKPGAST